MNLNLIYGRFNIWIFHQMLKMVLQKITNTNIFDSSLLLQLNQCFPSFQPNWCVFLVFRLEPINSGPMNQYQIEIFAIQWGNDSLDCLSRFLGSLLLITNFTCNVQFFSFNPNLLNSFLNFSLVLITAGSIKMSVSKLNSCLYSLNAFFTLQFISTESNNGYFTARVQSNGWLFC